MKSPAMPRERGFVLPAALLLLATVVVVALSGQSTASMELVMAGHEQGRTAAQATALAGIEVAIDSIAAGALEPVVGASRTFSGAVAIDSRARYDAVVRVAGVQPDALEAGGVRFDIVHYEITSRATAARGVVDEQVQGVAVVRAVTPDGGASPPQASVCFEGATLLPRCVQRGTPVRTFWRTTSVR